MLLSLNGDVQTPQGPAMTATGCIPTEIKKSLPGIGGLHVQACSAGGLPIGPLYPCT